MQEYVIFKSQEFAQFMDEVDSMMEALRARDLLDYEPGLDVLCEKYGAVMRLPQIAEDIVETILQNMKSAESRTVADAARLQNELKCEDMCAGCTNGCTQANYDPTVHGRSCAFYKTALVTLRREEPGARGIYTLECWDRRAEPQ